MHVDAAIAVAVVDDHDYRLFIRAPEFLQTIVDRVRIALIAEVRVVVAAGIQNDPVVRRTDLVVAVRDQVDAVVIRDAIDDDEATVGGELGREPGGDERVVNGPDVSGQLRGIDAVRRGRLGERIERSRRYGRCGAGDGGCTQRLRSARLPGIRRRTFVWRDGARGRHVGHGR